MPPAPVVVGAGLAGLTFALAALRHDLEVTVQDERAELGGGAALTLWPNALAALDHVGWGDAVRDLGEPVAGGGVRRADGAWVRRLDPSATVRALGEPLRVVDRGELQSLLLAAVGRDRVRLGVRAQSPEGDLVVGADGYRSVVARHLDPSMSETYAGYVAWRGVAPLAVDPALAGVVWGERGEAGVMPMRGGRTYWFVTSAGAEDQIGPPAAHWPDPLPDLVAATGREAILRHPMYDRTMPRRWHDGRCVVIGDAAHAMQPGLGQGGCTAIEDAVVLADLLAATDPVTAFTQFERRRRRRVAPIVRAARTAGDTLHSSRGRLLAPVARRVPQPLVLAALRRVAGRSAWEAAA
ncbi:FAD binding domain protein [Aeromicrobium marinum DSM 15272]|uniref:FAD binding domain protein n=1 Tax=Aeromicrobium marinum DSM 15272 TaxID=585531 RepID=E2SFA4_9ACTN|nr:FAD-dependent monooxygenase [Aeromicrobium marinum]EFQ82189.1 FAD binding domain protein [Aeromicrobium marinum DSM 15272]